MKRTNIYLTESQAAALDEVARAEGTSRAEVIRELIDRALAGSRAADLDADLAAIYGSFGTLVGEPSFPARGPDARAEYLNRLADS
jgi:hypothetical protein